MNRKFILIISLFLMSCASKKDILYFQDIEDYNSELDVSKNEIRIQKYDMLSINVSSVDRKSAAPFNLPAISTINSDITSASSQQRLQNYLVNNDGNIQFPVLGEINLLGKTTTEAIEYIKESLRKYIKTPIVNLRVVNFKVSVLGEVRRPGRFDVDDERITILEAISRAGDMTVFGKRKNVLVIRENDGKKTYNKLDFTSSNLLSSPFYYLKQNDVVMVSPNKAQIQSSAFNRNTSVFVSLAGLIISVISIFTR